MPVNTWRAVNNGKLESAQNTAVYNAFWTGDQTDLKGRIWKVSEFNQATGLYAADDRYDSQSDVFSNLLNMKLKVHFKNNQEVPCHLMVYTFVYGRDSAVSPTTLLQVAMNDPDYVGSNLEDDPFLTLADANPSFFKTIRIKQVKKYYMRPGAELHLAVNNGNKVFNSNTMTSSHRPEYLAGTTFGMIFRLQGTIGEDDVDDDDCGFMASKLHYIEEFDYKYQVSNIMQKQYYERSITLATDPDVIAQEDVQILDQGAGNEV